jgi:hypothetical protein
MVSQFIENFNRGAGKRVSVGLQTCPFHEKAPSPPRADRSKMSSGVEVVGVGTAQLLECTSVAANLWVYLTINAAVQKGCIDEQKEFVSVFVERMDLHPKTRRRRGYT